MRKYKSVVATLNQQIAREAASGGELTIRCCSDDDVLALARHILDRKLRANANCLESPDMVRQYLRLHIGALEHEEFHALFLNAQHQLICHESLFRGTLTQTSVYPREVVKTALRHNAAAMIFSHNHPSGVAEPSIADQHLTRTLREALGLVDVRVLDHIIIAGAVAVSFSERGLL